MASITVTWQPNDSFTPITHWTTDDLPNHIKGNAYWVSHSTHPGGYYYEEPGQEPVPVEFVNDAWYILHFSSTEWIYGACSLYQIDTAGRNIGLGHWNKNEPAHPNNQIPQIQVTNLTEHQALTPVISESGSKQNQPTWGPDTVEPTS